MDENLNIHSLAEKYEQMQALGKKIYLDAEEFVALAEHYNELGDDDEAVILINKGLEMHPTNPELMLLKAKTLVFGEQYEEAMAYMKNMTDDDDIDLILLKIESFLHLKQDSEAIKLIEKTLSDLSDDEEDKAELCYFITEMGYLYNDVDRYDKAIAFLEESLQFDTENEDIIVDLAYSYEMKGDFEKAIEYNNRLLDLDPYSFDGWVNIGKLYSICDHYEKALDAFDFALTIKENDFSALKLRALALHLNGNTEEAIYQLKSCMQLIFEDEMAYETLLETLESMEQYDAMLDVIDEKERRFGSVGIAIKRAFVYLNKDDVRKANKYFLQIPDNEKNSVDYYMLDGELSFYKNDFERSEIAYMKAAVVLGDNEDILDRLANISVAQEKFEQAAEYFEQLLGVAPDFPSARLRFAFVRFEIGTKEPFDELINQFSDDELRTLLTLIMGGNERSDLSDYSREKMLFQLDEARKNRVLFKNMRY